MNPTTHTTITPEAEKIVQDNSRTLYGDNIKARMDYQLGAKHALTNPELLRAQGLYTNEEIREMIGHAFDEMHYSRGGTGGHSFQEHARENLIRKIMGSETSPVVEVSKAKSVIEMLLATFKRYDNHFHEQNAVKKAEVFLSTLPQSTQKEDKI